MKRAEMKLKVGDRYMSGGEEVIVMDPVAFAKVEGQRKHWIMVRRPGDGKVFPVSTKSLKQESPATPAPDVPAAAGGLMLCFTVEFRIPAARAEVIESVLALLRGEGTADVIGVKTLK